MRKKIVIGTLFIITLLFITPFLSNIQANSVLKNRENDGFLSKLTSCTKILLRIVVNFLALCITCLSFVTCIIPGPHYAVILAAFTTEVALLHKDMEQFSENCNFNDMIEGITKNIEELIVWIQEKAGDLMELIIGSIGDIIAGLQSFITSIVELIIKEIPAIIRSILLATRDLIDWLLEKLPEGFLGLSKASVKNMNIDSTCSLCSNV